MRCQTSASLLSVAGIPRGKCNLPRNYLAVNTHTHSVSRLPSAKAEHSYLSWRESAFTKQDMKLLTDFSGGDWVYGGNAVQFVRKAISVIVECAFTRLFLWPFHVWLGPTVMFLKPSTVFWLVGAKSMSGGSVCSGSSHFEVWLLSHLYTKGPHLYTSMYADDEQFRISCRIFFCSRSNRNCQF